MYSKNLQKNSCDSHNDLFLIYTHFFNIVVVCLLICFVPTYFKILFGIQKQCDISSLIDSGNFVIFFPFFVTMCLELVISPSRMICWVDLPSVSMCHILPIQEERWKGKVKHTKHRTWENLTRNKWCLSVNEDASYRFLTQNMNQKNTEIIRAATFFWVTW